MWTVTFQNDTDNPDVGTATAVFVENGVTLARYADRVDQKSFDSFVNGARQALQVAQKYQADTSAIAAKLADALNG